MLKHLLHHSLLNPWEFLTTILDSLTFLKRMKNLRDYPTRILVSRTFLKRMLNPTISLPRMSSSLTPHPNPTHRSAAHETAQGCHNPCHPQSGPKLALDQVPSHQWARYWLLTPRWLKYHQGRWSSPWRGRTADCSCIVAQSHRHPIGNYWEGGAEPTNCPCRRAEEAPGRISVCVARERERQGLIDLNRAET